MTRSLFATAACAAVVAWLATLSPCRAADAPYQPAEPQKTGWPLTDEERAFVLKPEYERRPGREQNKHLPHLWPVVPAAGFWTGTTWLDTHAKLVAHVASRKGPVDVLLVGDSITQQWGSPLDGKPLNAAWQKHLGGYSAVNIGIGGDKAQNVHWRLDHGGVAGLEPRAVVLMIGNNNMFFTPETGVEAAARGVEACARNLRGKFPKAPLVVVKILPAHAPGVPFYEDIKKTNVALDGLKLDADPLVRVLDLTADFTNADGTLKKDLFTPDNTHLSAAGYDVYATRLKPLLEAALGPAAAKLAPGTKPAADAPAMPAAAPAVPPAVAPPAVARPAAAPPATASVVSVAARPAPVAYPYAPYNEGRMDPQPTGWPLSDAARRYVETPEYSRKPGHEANKHLPEMWPVTPSAAHWGAGADGGNGNRWLAHHEALLRNVRAAAGPVDVALIGDSNTQGWGGG